MTPSSDANTPIVPVSRMAMRYTIQCSLPNTHTVYIELDGGNQAGREGGREGARKDGRGGRKQGRMRREGARGGSEEAKM